MGNLIDFVDGLTPITREGLARSLGMTLEEYNNFCPHLDREPILINLHQASPLVELCSSCGEVVSRKGVLN